MNARPYHGTRRMVVGISGASGFAYGVRLLQLLAELDIETHLTISRGAMLKGSGIETLWPNFLALLAFTVVLVSFSIWRFRKQLS